MAKFCVFSVLLGVDVAFFPVSAHLQMHITVDCRLDLILCHRYMVCRAFLKQREAQDSDLSKDGSGIFKDPLMDTVYGQVPLALLKHQCFTSVGAVSVS